MSDITVTGNISEPELRFTASGTAVLNFALAENHSKKDAAGTWQDDGVTWRRVAVWDTKGEDLAEVLHKGDLVIVQGSERLREFDAKDGSKGKSLEVNARTVGVVPKRQQQAGQQSAPQPARGGDPDGAPF